MKTQAREPSPQPSRQGERELEKSEANSLLNPPS